jgi:hypothetical protein
MRSVASGRAWHRLIDGDDPLDGLGEGRQRARLNETKELLTGDVGARPVRHHDGEVSGEQETQARGKKEPDGKQSPEPPLGVLF